MPIGTSIKPTLFIFPARANTFVPLLFSVPIEANHSGPLKIIGEILAKVSTLLTLVGSLYNLIQLDRGVSLLVHLYYLP